jgi:S1-C subfamily serine protease
MAVVASGAEPRFVVDDDAYADKITAACAKLLKHHQLLPAKALQAQVKVKDAAIKTPAASHQKYSLPDLYDRLRESTVAIGNYYKCPDCPNWHFSSSTGFVVGEGVVSTCCHVVQAEDKGVEESYLVAADSSGRVFPVQSVLAADTDSDTCLVKIDAPDLKPLALRAGVRPGERVFCLSHPGGYFFMFSQGIVARVNRRCDPLLDDHGQTNGLMSRPILCLNITAEFAPGSSGAPVVDEECNVVGQVASIADAGEREAAETNAPPSPSVPVRFCTATEEIARLTRRHAERTNQLVRATSRPVHATPEAAREGTR